jgi:hypothetical protein
MQMKSPSNSLRLMLMVIAAVAFAGSTGEAKAEEDPTFGTWALGSPAPGHLLATHATLMRNHKILVVGGSSYNCCFAWGKEDTRLYDIASNSWSPPLASPAPYGSDKDAFCSGHAQDYLGRVIFQGGLLGYGHLNGHGIGNSARYDPASGQWKQLENAVSHWYPTLVAGVRHMFIFAGRDTQMEGTGGGPGDSIEKMAYGTTAWTSTGVSLRTKATYPRVSLLPNGKLFVASPADTNRKNQIFDPGPNTLAPAGNDVVPESAAGQLHCCESWKSTGVLLPLVANGGSYPQMRFALLNGVNAYVKDLGQPNPTWQSMGTRPPELGSPTPLRTFANSTLLPTGQILVTGGVGAGELDSAAVTKAEVYDPETNRWLLTSAASVPRNYHGVALLLPDGRVWTASASQNHSGSQCDAGCSGAENTEERVEIFTPWYHGRRDRPVVTSCPANVVTGGAQFDIGIGASQGRNVGRVVMMRPGSVTHSFDTDQRLIRLDVVAKTGSKVTVKSPYTAGAAPPGDYMIFALRSSGATGFKRWVPSEACWTRVARFGGEGAAIWQYTGTPCTGESCPGWLRLDNNTKTIAIASAGSAVYQLHNDGWIWRYTGTACDEESCPGWQRLDNNSKTVAIAVAGDQLYQLHNDGWIWRYTGTPCSGNNCPGWQRLDNNAKTVAIAAAGHALYQLHNDGWIWRYTGTPCSGDNCPGWQRLDNNAKTVAIAAAGSELHQLHNDGWIWRYTGTPCSGDNCPGWQRLDNNAKAVAIAAAGNELYQLHNDGWIWRHTGTPCSGDHCPGWQRLDNNSRTSAIAAGGASLFQLHNDGRIWRYIGTPCSGDSCPGWRQLDNNPRSGMVAVGDEPHRPHTDHLHQLHTDPLYQLHNGGAIWRYTGTECQGELCPGWERVDNNARTAEIVAAGGQLFQRHTDGRIWRSTGSPCSAESCPGWQQLDNNPKTVAIAAGGIRLYQLHNDGWIWRYTGRPCSGNNCPGWQRLDNNPRTAAIAATGTGLFQLHRDGRIWRSTGQPCNGESCPGWQQLDNNPNTKSIAAGANQLFQLHGDGRIWRSTGQPCSGESCPGWQQLDNNPKTVAIAAGGNQLYQLHNDGWIWRYTGVPCSGNNCPGWERLDNNAQTRDIVATGNHLYQRHGDGRIWRYIGPPCSGDSCPGWQQLDNNPQTRRLAVGGFN